MSAHASSPPRPASAPPARAVCAALLLLTIGTLKAARIPHQTTQLKMVCQERVTQLCWTWPLAVADVQLAERKLHRAPPQYLCGISDSTETLDHMETFVSSPGNDVTVATCKRTIQLPIYNLNDWSLEYRKGSRQRRQVSYRGRFRGQTQSQYLAIDQGANKDEGKAEAISAADTSKAVVSGKSGMGQAQSQSMYDPSCDECVDRYVPGAESLRRPTGQNRGNGDDEPGGGGTNGGDSWKKPGTHGRTPGDGSNWDSQSGGQGGPKGNNWNNQGQDGRLGRPGGLDGTQGSPGRQGEGLDGHDRGLRKPSGTADGGNNWNTQGQGPGGQPGGPGGPGGHGGSPSGGENWNTPGGSPENHGEGSNGHGGPGQVDNWNTQGSTPGSPDGRPDMKRNPPGSGNILNTPQGHPGSPGEINNWNQQGGRPQGAQGESYNNPQTGGPSGTTNWSTPGGLSGGIPTGSNNWNTQGNTPSNNWNLQGRAPGGYGNQPDGGTNWNTPGGVTGGRPGGVNNWNSQDGGSGRQGPPYTWNGPTGAPDGERGGEHGGRPGDSGSWNGQNQPGGEIRGPSTAGVNWQKPGTVYLPPFLGKDWSVLTGAVPGVPHGSTYFCCVVGSNPPQYIGTGGGGSGMTGNTGQTIFNGGGWNGSGSGLANHGVGTGGQGSPSGGRWNGQGGGPSNQGGGWNGQGGGPVSQGGGSGGQGSPLGGGRNGQGGGPGSQGGSSEGQGSPLGGGSKGQGGPGSQVGGWNGQGLGPVTQGGGPGSHEERNGQGGPASQGGSSVGQERPSGGGWNEQGGGPGGLAVGLGGQGGPSGGGWNGQGGGPDSQGGRWDGQAGGPGSQGGGSGGQGGPSGGGWDGQAGGPGGQGGGWNGQGGGPGSQGGGSGGQGGPSGGGWNGQAGSPGGQGGGWNGQGGGPGSQGGGSGGQGGPSGGGWNGQAGGPGGQGGGWNGQGGGPGSQGGGWNGQGGGPGSQGGGSGGQGGPSGGGWNGQAGGPGGQGGGWNGQGGGPGSQGGGSGGQGGPSGGGWYGQAGGPGGQGGGWNGQGGGPGSQGGGSGGQGGPSGGGWNGQGGGPGSQGAGWNGQGGDSGGHGGPSSGWKGQGGGPGSQGGGWKGQAGGPGSQGGGWNGPAGGPGNQGGGSGGQGGPSGEGWHGQGGGPGSQGGVWNGQGGGPGSQGGGSGGQGGPSGEGWHGQGGGPGSQGGGWHGQAGGPGSQGGASGGQGGHSGDGWNGQAGDTGGQGGGTGGQGGPSGGGWNGQGGGPGSTGGNEQIVPGTGGHHVPPQNVIDPNSIPAEGEDSQAESSITQNANGTMAIASSNGGNDKGRAKTQVSGTYAGSGTFSAQAEISDESKGAQSEVSGGKHGAISIAQGHSRNSKSQANVNLGSETGSLTSGAQSDGVMHSSNTQVQGGVKGGSAEAQARGPGSTSSQAQIGFTPFKDTDRARHDLFKSPFVGAGKASSHSNGRIGESQSQLEGTFKYGIKYTGAAQSGASLDKDAVFASRLPFNKIDVFDKSDVNINVDDTETPPDVTPLPLPDINDVQNNVANITEKPQDKPGDRLNGHTHLDHHMPGNENKAVPMNPPPAGNTRSFQPPYVNNNADFDYTSDKEDNPSEDYDADGGFGPEGSDAVDGEYNYDDFGKDSETHQSLHTPSRKSFEIKQSTGGNTQHIVLGALHGQDAIITQRNTDHRPDETRIYQPGESVPGTGGYIIPVGFTGSVKSVASKKNTYAVGTKRSPSQAQTVSLTPGSGKVKYVYPNPKVTPYGKYVSPKDLRSYSNNNKDDSNRYVSVSKTVTGALDNENNIRKQYSHTYYTKSSSCGYFTFTCTMVSGPDGRKKVCKPKIPTNPDGTPMRC